MIIVFYATVRKFTAIYTNYKYYVTESRNCYEIL